MTELQKAVYQTLQASPHAMHVRDIYAGVKARVPHLCDDAVFPCPYCKQKHPLWQHQAAWALQILKQRYKLVVSAGRGYWKMSELEKEGEKKAYVVTTRSYRDEIREEKAEVLTTQSYHDEIRQMIYEIGQMEGKVSQKEHHINGERIDVAWKRIEAGNPYVVFEVQIGGNFYEALAKLKHAWDKWNSRPFLVTTEQYKERALSWIRGSFHEIENQMKIIECQRVTELYAAIKKARDIKVELGIS